jgi:hypothetical protein
MSGPWSGRCRDLVGQVRGGQHADAGCTAAACVCIGVTATRIQRLHAHNRRRTMAAIPMGARNMKLPAVMMLLLAGMLATGTAAARSSNVTDADAPRSLPADGPVDVRWTDPAQFSEIRNSSNRWEAQRGNWVHELARYLRKRASARLPAGERLAVTITDIERAGEFEPWHGARGDSIRYMRDIYPPRIALDFKLVGADGSVLAHGSRKLSDLGYLQRAIRPTDSDPLRYEKQLIDDWLREEFDKPAA